MFSSHLFIPGRKRDLSSKWRYYFIEIYNGAVIKNKLFFICLEKLIMSIEKPKPKEYFQFQASTDENRRARITLVLFVFNLFVAVL